MTEDQDAKDSQSDSGSKSFASKIKDKKGKTHRPLTKIIIRRLPPTMTEEAFLEQVSPIPEHDHFYFAKPDLSLGNNVYARAYINFVNIDDIYIFRDKFDGYVFLDDKADSDFVLICYVPLSKKITKCATWKGVEYVGIVEYAPFQRILKKKKKKDPKCGTIESDPVYQEFIENLNKDQETENQPKLEYSYPISDPNDKKVQTTPLLEYLAARKQDKRGRDERRRRENDKRKMRIERKTKDIKKSGDLSEDDNLSESYEQNENKPQSVWYREGKSHRKCKIKSLIEVKSVTGRTEDFKNSDSDWDTNFPALTVRTHNTFTLTSNKIGDKNVQEHSQNSGGDTNTKEDDFVDNDFKKIKHREWEKDKISEEKDETIKSESKDGIVFESKTFKDQRKNIIGIASDKKKTFDDQSNDDKDKKERRDKVKEIPREPKSKKYSDTRKERLKQFETPGKAEKQAVINKIISSDVKSKLNHDDIKPFTQLPQVKTDDLSKLIEDMDRKSKAEDKVHDKADNDYEEFNDSDVSNDTKMRRNSLDSGELPSKESSIFKKQISLDDRSKSTDREESEEKEKSESTDRRTARRTRNKDRPSLPIYQPGMGKFSKQRLAKESQPAGTGKVSDGEKKDT